MEPSLIFIYDGECPFCNHFAQLVEIKSKLPNIKIQDARKNPLSLPPGYDMNTQGAILIKDGELLQGAEAINWICIEIEQPSDKLLGILKMLFTSKTRTFALFPLLLIARRATLFLKGVSWRLNNNHI